MSPAEIVKMPAGPALDTLVHQQVFEARGKAPPYSTDDTVAITILDRLPLFLARVDPGKPDYNPEKPYVAGRLQHENSVRGDITILRVVGRTKALVLAKAALMTLSKVGAAVSVRANNNASMSERINQQLSKRQKKVPAPTIPIRKVLPQPLAGVTKTAVRLPLPPRKQFVPGMTEKGK